MVIESLETLQQYLDSPELEAEVQMSAANLLWDMRRSHPAEVMAIAKKLATSKSRAVSDKAKRTLKDLDKSKWTQTLLGVAGSRMAFADLFDLLVIAECHIFSVVSSKW
ncbi:MAG: hypothetical protein ISS70_18360 [Phycisphaerae bacterium]|nr:hypothetical protein [Phycisphaerae bacterium]